MRTSAFLDISMVENGTPRQVGTRTAISSALAFSVAASVAHTQPLPRGHDVALHAVQLARWRWRGAAAFTGRAPGNETLRVKADGRGGLNCGLQQHLELSFCKPEGIKSNTLNFLWQSFILACGSVYWKSLVL